MGGVGERGGRGGDRRDGGGGVGEWMGEGWKGRGHIPSLLPLSVGTVVLQPTCPYSSGYSGPPTHLSVLQ